MQESIPILWLIQIGPNIEDTFGSWILCHSLSPELMHICFYQECNITQKPKYPNSHIQQNLKQTREKKINFSFYQLTEDTAMSLMVCKISRKNCSKKTKIKKKENQIYGSQEQLIKDKT